MYKFAKVFFTFIFVVLTSISCSKDKNSPLESDSGSEKNIEKKAIMEINSITYYEEDFFNFASTVLIEMDAESFTNTVIQEQLIKDFIEHKLLIEEAKKIGISDTGEDIDKVIQTISSEEGGQNLKVYSGNYSSNNQVLSTLLKERRIVEALLANVINSNIVITDREIRQQYEAKESKETPEAKAHILHIFTKNLNQAENAYKELKKGLSFNEVAGRYSEGPEKEQGGDLGFIAENDFPEIFHEAFKLVEGRFSNIIKSDYGYHIFLVKKFLRPKKNAYEDVKPKIYFELYSKKQEEKTREYINALYLKSNINRINNIDFLGYRSKMRDSK